MKEKALLQSGSLWPLFREGLWIILGQASAIVGALIGVRLLTELMDPSAYGELALGLTMATLVDQVVFGPLANGVARFYAPAREGGDIQGYMTAVRRMMFLATAGIILVGMLLIGALAIARYTEWLGLTASALFFGVLSGNNASLNGIQNAARQRSIVALHNGIESWVRFLSAAGLMILMGATSTVAMIGCALGVVLVLGSQCIFIRKIAPKTITVTDNGRGWLEQIYKYSFPFSTWGIFTWAQLASDRWALGIFETTKEVGLYAVLFQLGYHPISRATGMAMQFFSPIFYERAGDARDVRRNVSVNNMSWRLTMVALGVTFAIFLLALLFHKQIFRIIVAKEYESVSFLLPWLLLASGVFAAGESIVLKLKSDMKTHSMMKGKITTALLGILLNFSGAYLYGTKGIVIAGIFFSSIYFLWMVVLSKKTNEVIPRPYKKGS